MTKDQFKHMLESYKFDNQLLIEKNAELTKLNEQHFKKLAILKPISLDNNEIFNNAISKYKAETFIIENEIEKILNKRRDIENIIAELEQPYRNVLYFRYVKCLSIEEIAMKMNYSPQRIYQLHDIGIKKLEEKQKDAV